MLKIVNIKSTIVFFWLCYTLLTCWYLGNITKILFFCILTLCFVPHIKVLNNSSLYAFLFGMSYSIFACLNDEISDFSSFLLFLIPPFFFFVYGKSISNDLLKKNHLLDFYIITSLLFGIAVYSGVLLNIFGSGQIVNFRRELLVGNNENVDVTSATLIGLNVSLGFAALPIACFCKINIIRRLFCVFLFLLSFMTTIHLINRTGLIVIFVTFLVVYFYKNRGNYLKFTFFIVLAILILVLSSKCGFIDADIIDAYNQRSDDLSSGGGRFYQWLDGAFKLFTDPLGYKLKNSSQSLAYVHNLWLDVARTSGIVPFFFLSLITIRMIKQIIVVAREMNNNSCILIAIFSAVILSVAVEPVMDGFPIFLYVFLMY